MRTGVRDLAKENSNLVTAVSSEVDLCIDPAAVIFDQLERVTRVTMHIVVAIGGTAVREEDGDLVSRLWVLGKIIL